MPEDARIDGFDILREAGERFRASKRQGDLFFSFSKYYESDVICFS